MNKELHSFMCGPGYTTSGDGIIYKDGYPVNAISEPTHEQALRAAYIMFLQNVRGSGAFKCDRLADRTKLVDCFLVGCGYHDNYIGLLVPIEYYKKYTGHIPWRMKPPKGYDVEVKDMNLITASEMLFLL